ncbi:FtsQ-type POTRA domain-containing protein [Christensenellaceae bacterium NSJ-44]|uniref:FtsQ-type POTRA domain-containing protein n=2 Tax=Luoshenia tenuis TaxID=2763654 RepID=A0A926D3Y0_9FIRM|nr:FtsQ-type POTRA domain-containing protein [Luoshenia tenuis]MBC8529905.1 FtsQ-type POTRA domain-containing protein [Luoshenia tenuis]
MAKASKEKKKMKKPSTLVTWLLGLLLALTLAAILNLEVLIVRDVQVYGNETVATEDIVGMAGVALGENIFKVNLDAVKANIEENPYLVVDHIGYKLPDKISIVLHERKARAVLEYLSSYILIDEEGTLLELKSKGEDVPELLVKGVEVVSFTTGKKAELSNPYQMEACGMVLSEFYTQNAQELISEMDLSNPDDITLKTTAGIAVRFGQAKDVEKKVTWVRTLIPQLQAEGKVGTLDVTAAETGASFREEPVS